MPVFPAPKTKQSGHFRFLLVGKEMWSLEDVILYDHKDFGGRGLGFESGNSCNYSGAMQELGGKTDNKKDLLRFYKKRNINVKSSLLYV